MVVEIWEVWKPRKGLGVGKFGGEKSFWPERLWLEGVLGFDFFGFLNRGSGRG